MIAEKINFILSSPEKKKLIGLAFGSLFLALSETISIGIIIPIMNLFISPEKVESSWLFYCFRHFIAVQDRIIFLRILIISAMLIFFLKSIYSIFILYSQYNFTGKVYHRLTKSVLSSYLYKPYSFHLENNSSILFKNTTAEVGQFTNCFLSPAISVGAELMVSLGILTLLIYSYPILTLLSLSIFLIAILFLNFFLKRRIKFYSNQREKSYERMYLTATEALCGIKEIQVNSVQSFFTGRFSQATSKYQDSCIKFDTFSVLPRYLLEIILFLSMLTIILLSLHFNNPPENLIPMMAVMGIASLKLLPSVSKIYNNFNIFHYYSNSLDIVYSILKETSSQDISKAKPRTNSIKLEIGSLQGSSLRLEKIKFFYKQESTPIFEDLSISIPFAKTTVFVGLSGTGKSTLIDILTGLLIPSEGTVYYDNIPVTYGNISEYRKKIGYVPQQIFLIDDTIEANIAFGVPVGSLDYKQLKSVIKIAQLESFIETLPSGIKTSVGERGIRLSGGQRQRIGIARALYRNPEILILDEATSALDGHTESEVIKAMDVLRERRMAIILVAHRLSTISHADIIYVMDQGRIVAQGDLKTLLEKSDVFKKVIQQKDADSLVN